MIHIKQKGDFSKVTHYFQRVEKAAKIKDLDKYGKKGSQLYRKLLLLLPAKQRIRGITKS